MPPPSLPFKESRSKLSRKRQQGETKNKIIKIIFELMKQVV